MALDKSALKQQIKAAFTQAQSIETTADAAEYLSNAIANAVDSYVKSGTVSFQAGQITGIAPSGGGNITAGAGSGGTIS